jgi:hypothetical protein
MISRGERKWNKTSPMDTCFDLIREIYGVITPKKVPFQGLPLKFWSWLILGEKPVTIKNFS